MKLFLTIISSLYSLLSHEQIIREFTDQQKTQITYRVKQIAALKAYAAVAEKGYDIAQKGLSTIHQVKNGDFELHQIHFSALSQVNHCIKKLSLCADMVSLAIAIIGNCKKVLAHLHDDQGLTGKEVEYIQKVNAELIEGCSEILDQLSALTTDGVVMLSDDARLRRLQSLHEEILDRFRFLKSFLADVRVLSHQRQLEQQETTRLQHLFGLDH